MRVTTSMLKSWGRKCKKGETSRPPKAEKLFMRLDDHVAKFRGDRVVITIGPRRYLDLKLSMGGILEEIRRGLEER